MTEERENNNIEATTPKDIKDTKIPVKFNKEIKYLTVEEASILAQKGMKYDLIADTLEQLKKLALGAEKTIPQFLQNLENEKIQKRKEELLEKCSGDNDLVEKIISFEGNHTQNNHFDEIEKYFPNIKSEEDLPKEVRESSKLKGTLLLDEYLRYLLAQKKRQEKSKEHEEKVQKASIGSLKNCKSPTSPETEEFIKGLWK